MRILSAFVLIIFCMSTSIIIAQKDVVMTIDGQDVTLEEFEYIYKKNNREQIITKDSLDNYLDLFVNFKLKVTEARNMGLDTNRSFISELNGYRKQLARPYLTDGDLLDDMVQESYERMNKEIKASHILVKCRPNSNPADTLKAYNKILKLRDRIMKGEDFEKVAKSKGGSEDESVVQNGGNLGYFSAFQMLYPFESAAYNTKVGEVSQPVRTKYGYHIIKVVDSRKAQGELKVAHIMVQSKNKDGFADAEMKANEIHDQLMNGAEFGDMALKYSDDTGSKKNGGELPWFGTGKMIPVFEDAAFKLKNNGDISKPVRSDNGFFIIKRLDYKPVADFKTVEKELKTKISRDARSEKTKDSFVQKMKMNYGYKLNESVVEEFRSRVDTGIYAGTLNIQNEEEWNKILDMEINSLDGKSHKASELYEIIKKNKKRIKSDKPLVVFESNLKKFEDNVVLDYEDSRLEQKHSDFRLLMNEYRDGMLLFELTDEKVWSKAVKDTTGLENFYNQNKDKYKWEERVDATIYTCPNKKLAKKARKLVKKGKSLVEIESIINQTSSLNLQNKSGVLDKKKNEELELIKWQEGVSKVKPFQGQFIFVDVDKIMPEEIKELSETRGPVTADYQKYLEDIWIKELRNKYSYTVNDEVLYKLVNK